MGARRIEWTTPLRDITILQPLKIDCRIINKQIGGRLIHRIVVKLIPKFIKLSQIKGTKNESTDYCRYKNRDNYG